MVEIRKQKTFLDSNKRQKGILMNQPTNGGGKLTKDGRQYKNNLLNTDYTSQQMIRKKVK